VEAGKDEKQVSPFERAVAGLVLGGEDFVAMVRDRVKDRQLNQDEPSLMALRRTGRATADRVEKAVEQVFADEKPARRRRLLLYAQRLHSDLRPAEIARRYDRTRAAVTMATKQLFSEAQQNRELAAGLTALAAVLEEN
jgi:hypothetical protein